MVPHYDHHYHGTYYYNGGLNYYVPRTYVTDPNTYVVAKPAEVVYGGYAHVDDLAGRLERIANQLCLDLHYNYRQNPGFKEVYREAYRILETAKYIHAKENQSDKAEVARRVDELDGLFHNLQGEIQGWSRIPNRQIGEGGAQAKMTGVEATLHHLMNDVGVKGSHGAPEPAQAPASEEVAPPPEAPVEPAAESAAQPAAEPVPAN